MLRVSPEGALDRLVGVPVPCPTDVAVGPDQQLFVTTARQSVPLDVLANAPLSGSLLVVDL